MAKPVEKPVNEYVERIVEVMQLRFSTRVAGSFFSLPGPAYDDSGMHN